MSKYDFELHLTENDSITKIVNRIAEGSRVLEFGCAEGRMTKYLRDEKKCHMSIVEIDEGAFQVAREFAEDGICADIETDEWLSHFEGQQFDYLTFADVLEHLKDPGKALLKLKKLLKPDGSILVSIPNIAHNKILVKLFENRMDYSETGLLDNTHLKFWGEKNLDSFAENCGLKIIWEDMTVDPKTDGDQSIREIETNSKLLEALSEREYGQAYQFVFEMKHQAYCEEHAQTKVYGPTMIDSEKTAVMVFFDCGDDFTAENSAMVYTTLMRETNMRTALVHLKEGTKRLRFDPVEGICSFCRIYSAVDNKGNTVRVQAVNGYSYEGLDVFETLDPQYVLEIEDPEIQSVAISYNVTPANKADVTQFRTLFEFAQKLSDQEALLRAQTERADNLEKQVQDFKQHAEDVDAYNRELHHSLQVERRQWQSEKDGYEMTQAILQKDLQTLKADNTRKKNAIYDLRVKEEDMTEQINFLKTVEAAYHSTLSSLSWKITKPLRLGNSLVKKIMGKGPAKEGEAGKITRITPSGDVMIAVHLHLYYEDLLEEFCEYFDNITEPFDLYISVKEGADEKRIMNIAKRIDQVKKVTIRVTQNRGRDIAPFYVLFREELAQYKCLLHVHSKKSLYTGEEKVEWRHQALDGVLKSKTAVAEILRLMLVEKEVGLCYGDMTDTLPLSALHWLRNVPKGSALLAKMGIPFENEMLMYPVGSFFWVRTDAIRPLFDLKLTYEDFDEEHGQIDGTIAHALERVISYVSSARGYHACIYDATRNTFSMDVSYRSFESYFGYNVTNMTQALMNYDIISFDIFDTLVTRLVYKPDDLFLLMARKIKDIYGKNVDFLKLRKEAEAKANEEYGDFCNIHNIYEKLPLVSDFSEEESLALKEMEIELEYKLCVPRREAVEIFMNLVDAGKRVMLVSDMYLPKDVIENILKNCGISGYEEFYLSCELGLRKDKETMWQMFYEKYGSYNTIHVGDNPHSDCQLVGDMQRLNALWLSPRSQFRFSKQYETFKKYVDTTVENSLMLGYLVNNCLYNSPFALKGNGCAQLHDISDVAKTVFAPIFMVYAEFLAKSDAKKLLFLSREGYFLKKLYESYCEAFGLDAKDNMYFYTSRRAASVAHIETDEDVRTILQTNFDGYLSDLFLARFGMKHINVREDKYIKLPADIDIAMQTYEDNKEEIWNVIREEKAVYSEYLADAMAELKPEEVALCDVGYAGSIQYYLMKLCKGKLDGYYLATEYNLKPKKLGGKCESVYNFREDPVFHDTQLFLEAVTAAPHGQVVCMTKTDAGFEPILKEENETCYESAEVMQSAIYEYISNVGAALCNVHPRFDKKLAEGILAEILRANYIGDEMLDVFTVHDEYCKGHGEWKFDSRNYTWVLKED